MTEYEERKKEKIKIKTGMQKERETKINGRTYVRANGRTN